MRQHLEEPAGHAGRTRRDDRLIGSGQPDAKERRFERNPIGCCHGANGGVVAKPQQSSRSEPIIEIDHDNPRRIDADVARRNPLGGAEQNPGDDQQQGRNRNLRNKQSLAKARGSSARGRNHPDRGAHRTGTGSLQRGNQSEAECAEHSTAGGKEENPVIGIDGREFDE